MATTVVTSFWEATLLFQLGIHTTIVYDTQCVQKWREGPRQTSRAPQRDKLQNFWNSLKNARFEITEHLEARASR